MIIARSEFAAYWRTKKYYFAEISNPNGTMAEKYQEARTVCRTHCFMYLLKNRQNRLGHKQENVEHFSVYILPIRRVDQFIGKITISFSVLGVLLDQRVLPSLLLVSTRILKLSLTIRS